VQGVVPHRSYGTERDAGDRVVHPPTTATVGAGTAALLGVALDRRTLGQGSLRGRDGICVFSFSLTVPEPEPYRMEVGQRRGVVPFSRVPWNARTGRPTSRRRVHDLGGV
jgi:hypothetical protein